MNILPSGRRGFLVELTTLEDVLTTYAALRATRPERVLDIVPAARTILVVAERESDLASLAEWARTTTPRPVEHNGRDLVEIPVRYDGPDLVDAAGALGCSPDELISRHQEEDWTVAFTGFSPGFGYLTGRRFHWQVPRRERPRTSVQSGSVGLAGEFTGVYPRKSPGGWQLIGHALVNVFDAGRTPAALLGPGVRVRFVEAAQ